jgi:hypothetical protein
VYLNAVLKGPISLGLLYFRHKSERRKSNGQETASVSTWQGIRSHRRRKTPPACRVQGMVAHGWRAGSSNISSCPQNEKTSHVERAVTRRQPRPVKLPPRTALSYGRLPIPFQTRARRLEAARGVQSRPVIDSERRRPECVHPAVTRVNDKGHDWAS